MIKTVSSCSVIMLWKIVPYAQKYKNTYAALRVFRDGIMHIQILIALQVQIQPTTYVLCVFVYIIMKESRKLLSWDLCSSTSKYVHMYKCFWRAKEFFWNCRKTKYLAPSSYNVVLHLTHHNFLLILVIKWVSIQLPSLSPGLASINKGQIIF